MAKDDHGKDDGSPPKRRRGKPPVIELAATEIEPPQAVRASEPEPAAAPKPERTPEPGRPVPGKAWFGVFDRTAVRFAASIAVAALAGALIAVSVVLLFERGADTRLAKLAGDVAQLNARVEALAARPADGTAVTLGERMDRVTASLADIERRLVTVERRAPPPDIAPLAVRLGAIEAQLETLRKETAERLRLIEERLANLAAASRATVSPTLAGEIVALNLLRDALAAGAPFTAELAALRVLLAERAAPLAALAPAAASGLPTTMALARRFSELAPQLTRASVPAGGFFDRLAHSAGNLVDVRRVGEEPAGDDLASVVARMQARLERGDLAGAIDAAGKSPALAEGAAGEWLKTARLRRDADVALKTLIAASLASLAAEAGRP
ncbi:MAG TPA: mitofilin family membrane protein [Xanthobacteraceae bacterium]|nr:mitofilin family membrane protein [Xanthobacteraceae bacterium]